MKISWNILNSYFDNKLEMNEVLERLTLSGLEVESVEPVAPDFSGVVVAEVLEVVKHPDADKLAICQVNIGGATTQIVCGASNVAVGVRVPCATIGAVLPGDFHIAKRKMRGAESNGMLCGASEIGLVDTVDGLHILPSNAPIGEDIRKYLKLDDKIVEFKITPNRGDCLSYKGLVREIASIMAIANPWHDIEYNIDYTKASKLDIDNSLANSFNLLRVKNIDNTVTTPIHIIERLQASGVASISFVVDLTNYIMLTIGQPMHAYSGNVVNSDKLSLRVSKLDEEIELLNDKTVKLSAGIPLVVDANNVALAVAGVMGGKASSVEVNTSEIVVEAANFNTLAISGVARKIGVSSDSSYRFEREVDNNIAIDALALFMSELSQVCSQVQIVSVAMYTQARKSTVIKFYLDDIIRIIGFSLDLEQVTSILLRLGFEVDLHGEYIEVVVPSYRNDIVIKEDIAEEVIRVYGMDNIPLSMPVVESHFSAVVTNYSLEYSLKQKAAMLGYNEIIAYSFISEKDNELFASVPAVELQNPIAGLKYMRTNLLADLINSANYNINRGVKELRLVEISSVFHGEQENLQSVHLAMLLGGVKNLRSWYSKPSEFDFFDIKSHLEQLFLGYNLVLQQDKLDNIHPNRGARITYQGVEVGVIGQLHPNLHKYFELNNMPYYLEVDLGKLNQLALVEYQDVSKYQKVARDISLLKPRELNSQELIIAIRNLGIVDLVGCKVFDVYYDKNDLSQVSLAISVEFQSKETTLVEEQISSYVEQIKSMLVKTFAVILR